MERIEIAESDRDIERCYRTISELRPHVEHSGFVARIRQLMDQGYVLVALRDDDEVIAVAGYRLHENLHLGSFMYVDDLVTREHRRSRGAGGRLYAWLVARARTAGCGHLVLDSGVQRFRAHKFYLAAGMHIAAHHFVQRLD